MKGISFPMLMMLCVCLLPVGCATLVSTNEEMVTINSDPSGARVLIDDDYMGETPLRAKLSTNPPVSLRYHITIEKPGYETTEHYLERKLDRWVYGNAFFGLMLPLGVLVDYNSKSMYKLSDNRIESRLRALPPEERLDPADVEPEEAPIVGVPDTDASQDDPESAERQTGIRDRIEFQRGDRPGVTIVDDVSDAEAIRQAWTRRGGTIIGREMGFGLAALSNSTSVDLNPGFTTSNFNGTGGSIKMGLHNIRLRPPAFEDGILSHWWATKIGGDVEYNIFHTTMKIRTYIPTQVISTNPAVVIPAQEDEQELTSTFQQINLVGNFGTFAGLGTSEVSPLGWRGFEVGVNYRPSLVITIPDEGDSDSSFNAGGFSIDFGFGNRLSTSLDNIAPRPYSRLSFFFLPPVRDEDIFFWSISYSRLVY